jgi:DNA invertase Pin-like site-specific DNA recombinase
LTDTPRRRIALWCAVSTPEQANVEKDSLPTQEADGREWAGGLSADVVRVYSVPGHSRKYRVYYDAEADMEAYRQLRLDCEVQAFDVLWCRNRNRLGRTLALIAQVDSFVREVGMAEVYSAAMPHQLGRQTGRSATLLAAVEGWQAQADNEERTALMRMGMKGRVRRGMMPARPPMGYRTLYDEQGKSVGYEFDENADAIRLLTRLFLAGHSYQEMCRRMNASGYLAFKRTNSWRHGAVYDMMHNATYAGYPKWGDVQYEGDGPSPHYPPLWDAETYREILREHRRRKKGPYQHHTSGPFAGILFCRRCGGRMTKTRNRPGYVGYRCSTHTYPHLDRTCHNNFVVERRIVEAMVAYVQELQNPENIEAALEEWGQDDERDGLLAELEGLKEDVERLEAQRKRLALDRATGTMDAAMYRETDNVILRQLEAHEVRRVETERALESLPDADYQRDLLGRLAEGFPLIVQTVEAAEVAKLLRDAGFRVWCEDSRVVEITRGVV